MKMIAFRVDASLEMGTGHVMRCLTLADAMRLRGLECQFICREHPGHLIELIAGRGFPVHRLPCELSQTSVTDDPPHARWLGESWQNDASQTQNALRRISCDWLVVDHYALDWRWESALRPHCSKLMVIDDLADRQHDCDLLLDQNLGRNIDDYRNRVPPNTPLLIGPSYALLRPEFSAWRARSLKRRQEPKLAQLLITMGGVDQQNVTGRVLNALQQCDLPPALSIIVVMGPKAPWLEDVRLRAAQMSRPTLVLVGVSNMAELMAQSDLAIGAAGSTSWERCALGLPTIQIVLAENQRLIAHALLNIGAADTLNSDFSNLDFEMTVQGFQDSMRMVSMSSISSGIADGNGVSSVLDFMKRLF